MTGNTPTKPVPGWTWVALLLALSLFAIGPLLLPGYHWGAQDARHSVYFLFEFDRAISDGVLYPRWAPDFTFGYGYPFFNIYGPLSSYAGEALHLLGLDLVTAVKAVFALAAIGSALAMYLWLRLYTGPPAATLGALLYLYAPYHLADLYVRASLAEVVALAFLPLCLWGFGRLYRDTLSSVPQQTPGRAWGSLVPIVVAAGTYAGLMLSSNLLALLFSPILGGYILVLAWSRFTAERPTGPRSRIGKLGRAVRVLTPAALGVFLGLGLSAIFWVPAFLEHQYVRTDQWVGGYYEYRNHFVSLFQLFRLDWGFGASLAGPDDGMSFQLGLAPVFLTVMGLLSWRRLSPAWRRGAGYFLAITAGVVFLMLPLSEPVWEALGLVSFAQFPWRLLALTILSLAFLGAAAFSGWRPSRANLALTALWGLLVLLPVYPYLRSEVRPPAEGPVSLQGLMRFQQSADEMTGSTAWVERIPRWSPLADQIMAGIEVTTRVDYVDAYSTDKLAVHSQASGTTFERVWFQAKDDRQHVRFYTFYYPGWTAYILDENTGEVTGTAEIVPEGELGRISVAVPPGRHVLLLTFQDTPIRQAATGITLLSAVLSLVGLAAAAAFRRRRAR